MRFNPALTARRPRIAPETAQSVKFTMRLRTLVDIFIFPQSFQRRERPRVLIQLNLPAKPTKTRKQVYNINYVGLEKRQRFLFPIIAGTRVKNHAAGRCKKTRSALPKATASA